MLALIMKNWFKYLFPPAVVMAFPILYEAMSGINNPLIYTRLLGILIFFAALLPPVMIEIDEEKHGGYSFLASLPVTIEELVRIKFLMYFLTVLAVGLVDFAVLSTLGMSQGLMADCLNHLVSSMVLCLVIGGLIFISIFRFGVTPVMVGMGFAGLVVNFLFLIEGKYRSQGRSFFPASGDSIEDMTWYMVAAMALAAMASFYLMMRLATRIKAGKRI